MIFVKGDVSCPFEGEYFSDFVVVVALIGEFLGVYEMMMILLGPELFIGFKGGVFYG